MVYVIDSSSFGVLKNFYPSIFASFWRLFDGLVAEGRVVSVREVRKELKRRQDSPHLDSWMNQNEGVFSDPTEDELVYVTAIFSVEHFQALIRKNQLLRGYPVADPFLIAKALAVEGCVVSEERFKPNAATVPNVCEHFEVDCLDIEGFLRREGWSF